MGGLFSRGAFCGTGEMVINPNLNMLAKKLLKLSEEALYVLETSLNMSSISVWPSTNFKTGYAPAGRSMFFPVVRSMMIPDCSDITILC